MELPAWLRLKPQGAFLTPTNLTNAPDRTDSNTPRAEIATVLPEPQPVANGLSSIVSFRQGYRTLMGTAGRNAARTKWGEAYQAVCEGTFSANRALNHSSPAWSEAKSLPTVPQGPAVAENDFGPNLL